MHIPDAGLRANLPAETLMDLAKTTRIVLTVTQMLLYVPISYASQSRVQASWHKLISET